MFVNMDMVLEYIRTQPAYSDVMIEYATLSDYFEAVAEAEPAGGWEVLELEDFFPYISTNESNWTGFYSSRSSLKSSLLSLFFLFFIPISCKTQQPPT